MKEQFIDRQFRESSLIIIDEADEIIREYLDLGYLLTVRQLYYQFVARDLIPNTERSYKNLGKLMSQGRLAGLVDWDAMEDRLRTPQRVAEWESPADVMDAAITGYSLPRWENQPQHVELW